MTRVACQGQQFLEPNQLGVQTRGDCEAMVHAFWQQLRSRGAHASHALLHVDLANAFNLVFRSSFLRAARVHFPELYPWVALCYTSEPAHLQDDPLGPLLFALTLEPVTNRLRTLLPRNTSSDGSVSSLFLFNMDDRVVIATHDELCHILEELTSPRTLVHGRHLRMNKLSVWWPFAPSQKILESNPPAFFQDFDRPDTALLQTPLGADYFDQAHLALFLDKLGLLFQAIEDLELADVLYPLPYVCGRSEDLIPPLCTPAPPLSPVCVCL